MIHVNTNETHTEKKSYYIAINLFNNPPNTIRTLENVNMFRKILKTLLINIGP